MSPSTASKLILVLSMVWWLLPTGAAAHLRRTARTKGLRTQVANSERILQRGKSSKKGRTKVGKSNKESTSSLLVLDREETTYALGEAGQPLYIDETAQEDEDFNFVDLPYFDREDGASDAGFIIDIEGADGVETDGGDEMETPVDQGTLEVTETAPTGGTLANIIYTEFNEANFITQQTNATHPSDENEIAMDGDTIDEYGNLDSDPATQIIFTHEEPDTLQDMKELEAEESDLIENDGSHLNLVESRSQLEARLAEAEIQLDTLLQLSQTVLELEERLDTALKAIESQEKAINILAMAVMKPAGEGVITPGHIEGLNPQPKSEP